MSWSMMWTWSACSRACWMAWLAVKCENLIKKVTELKIGGVEELLMVGFDERGERGVGVRVGAGDLSWNGVEEVSCHVLSRQAKPRLHSAVQVELTGIVQVSMATHSVDCRRRPRRRIFLWFLFLLNGDWNFVLWYGFSIFSNYVNNGYTLRHWSVLTFRTNHDSKWTSLTLTKNQYI